MEEQDDFITGIGQGLEGLEKNCTGPDFLSLRNKLRKSVRKLNSPMQLAIIGRISASKSTLVNAILGKENIVATGQLEVTFNVSWIKYGQSGDPFIIHFKNGTSKEMKKDESWEQWSVRQGGTDLKTEVSYIEAFYDAEILKEINIIDTPGLDARMGVDSQNTLDFLKEQQPDAVLMLFTKSLTNHILQVVDEFNRGGSFNPINAMGVLAKTDTLWHTEEKEKNTLGIADRMIRGLLERNPSLRETLFDICPVSALMFLMSRTMTESELERLKRLSLVDEGLFDCMCDSANDFVDPSYETPGVTLNDRRELLAKFDRYAIYLIVRFLSDHPAATLDEVKGMVYRESGADRFMQVVKEHFGERARLIKAESIYRMLNEEVAALRAVLNSKPELLPEVELVEQQLADLFQDLIHFHREYELLNLIYHKKIDLEPDFADEFCRLCEGGNGPVYIRLGLEEDCSTERLIREAKEKERRWRMEVNQEFDRNLKDWKKVIRDAYTYLWYDLKTKYEQVNGNE